MKKLYIYLIPALFLGNYFTHIQTMNPQQTPTTPFNFTFNLPISQQQFAQPTTNITDYGNTTKFANISENKNTNKNENALHTNVHIATVISLCQQLQTTLLNKQSMVCSAFSSLWKRHAAKIVAASVITFYAACYASIWCDNRYLADQNNWSYWHEYARDSMGNIINTSETADRLLRAIQIKYLNNTQPTDHLSPLIRFIKDVDQEEQRILRYIWYTHVLNATPLSRILPCSKAQTDQAEELLAQLRIVKAIFNEWIAWYNNAQLYASKIA